MEKAIQILDHAKLTGQIKLDDVKYLLVIVADKVINTKRGRPKKENEQNNNEEEE